MNFDEWKQSVMSHMDDSGTSALQDLLDDYPTASNVLWDAAQAQQREADAAIADNSEELDVLWRDNMHTAWSERRKVAARIRAGGAE